MSEALKKSSSVSRSGNWIIAPYAWLKNSDHRISLAGWLFTGGNYGEIISSQYDNIRAVLHHGFGALHYVNMDVGQIIGAMLFIPAGHILAGPGSRDDRWFNCANVMAVIAIAATNASAMMELPAHGWSALTGTAIYTASYVIGIAGRPLYRAFKDAKNTVTRWTLGHPRLTMGLGAAISMAFMLPDSVSPVIATIFGSWLAAELLLASTNPDRASAHQSTTPSKPSPA